MTLMTLDIFIQVYYYVIINQVTVPKIAEK